MLTRSPLEKGAADLMEAHPSGFMPQSRTRGHVLIGTAVAVAVLLVAMSGLGVGRLSGTLNQPEVLPTLTLTTAVGPSADEDTVSAEIQQVIERADEQQAQAFSKQDPTLMADTATSDYYQQLLQTNQDLLDSGVTSIHLVTIEWASIDVGVGTATVTNWETWNTTYSDSSTEQSRDRNVYTLLQANGAWRIQSDIHPDQAQPTTSPSTRRPTPVPTQLPVAPTQPGSEATSHNWAGNLASGARFTGVSATWSVPPFVPGSPAGADAAWVGIGGVQTTDLIQAGTQQTTSGSCFRQLG